MSKETDIVIIQVQEAIWSSVLKKKNCLAFSGFFAASCKDEGAI